MTVTRDQPPSFFDGGGKSLKVWPQEDLETIKRCPVCDCAFRTTLYEGMRDIVFEAAPGAWALHRCHECLCAYLDPRPSRESIGLAYRNYYTHRGMARTDGADLTHMQRFVRALANDYRNRRFGTCELPAHWLGSVLAALVPAFRRRATPSLRALTVRDRGARVLDVGCGGGNFVYWAGAVGCRVFACEPDPVAAQHVRETGVEVRNGGIETYFDKPGFFDLITMGHVIEHLHDPRAVLEFARQLLRPGGRIWLETPNLASRGFKAFGQYWRGLEVPRHLVLFDSNSLSALAAKAGFVKIQVSAGSSGTILAQSADLLRKYDPERNVALPTSSDSLPDSETIQLTAFVS